MGKGGIIQKGLEKAIGTGQKSAVRQAEKMQKELQINRDAINELIGINNEQTKGILAIWEALKKLHAGDSGVFAQVEKELKIKMRLE